MFFVDETEPIIYNDKVNMCSCLRSSTAGGLMQMNRAQQNAATETTFRRKKHMKKNLMSILCLVLALVMVFGLVACTASEPEVEEPVVETPENGEPATEEREPVELVFYTHTPVVGPGKDEVIAAVNEYLKEKLNTTVDFQIYGQSDYPEVVPTIFNSGADMDLVLVGSMGVDFTSNVARNAFVALDDYIDEYLPGTKERLPEAAWDAYSYDGSVYGVAAVKDLANQMGFWVNQDMLDDLGLTFPENYSTYFDLVDLWKEAKVARDAKYPEKANQPLLHIQQLNHPAYWFHLDNNCGGYGTQFANTNIPGAITTAAVAEDGSEVTSLYYTDEYREYCKIIRELRELNVFSIGDEQNAYIDELLQTGEGLGGNCWGGVSVSATYSAVNAVLHHANTSALSTAGLQTIGFAVPLQCKNVERTLEVLELMNTDQYLATLLHFGIEGKGWNDVDGDGVLEFDGTLNDTSASISDRWWYQWYGNGLGACTASMAPAGYPADFADIIYGMNEKGMASANLGFSYDATGVQTELAACNSVVDEYTTILQEGRTADVDATLDEFIAKLHASGLDTIIADCQAQLDAWRAEKGL